MGNFCPEFARGLILNISHTKLGGEENLAGFSDMTKAPFGFTLKLALARARDGDKPFSQAMMCRVASFVVVGYWRKAKRKPTYRARLIPKVVL